MAGNVVRAKAHVGEYCRFNVKCELLATTGGGRDRGMRLPAQRRTSATEVPFLPFPQQTNNTTKQGLRLRPDFDSSNSRATK